MSSFLADFVEVFVKKGKKLYARTDLRGKVKDRRSSRGHENRQTYVGICNQYDSISGRAYGGYKEYTKDRRKT